MASHSATFEATEIVARIVVAGPPQGYPKAAVFAFCLALAAYNANAVVKAAMRATHRIPRRSFVCIAQASSRLLELIRKQVRISYDESQSHCLAGQHAEIGFLILPRGGEIEGIAVEFVGISERVSGNGFAIRILDLDANAAGRRC